MHSEEMARCFARACATDIGAMADIEYVKRSIEDPAKISDSEARRLELFESKRCSWNSYVESTIISRGSGMIMQTPCVIFSVALIFDGHPKSAQYIVDNYSFKFSMIENAIEKINKSPPVLGESYAGERTLLDLTSVGGVALVSHRYLTMAGQSFRRLPRAPIFVDRGTCLRAEIAHIGGGEIGWLKSKYGFLMTFVLKGFEVVGGQEWTDFLRSRCG